MRTVTGIRALKASTDYNGLRTSTKQDIMATKLEIGEDLTSFA